MEFDTSAKKSNYANEQTFLDWILIKNTDRIWIERCRFCWAKLAIPIGSSAKTPTPPWWTSPSTSQHPKLSSSSLLKAWRKLASFISTWPTRRRFQLAYNETGKLFFFPDTKTRPSERKRPNCLRRLWSRWALPRRWAEPKTWRRGSCRLLPTSSRTEVWKPGSKNRVASWLFQKLITVLFSCFRAQAKRIFSILITDPVFDKAMQKYLSPTVIRNIQRTLDQLRKNRWYPPSLWSLSPPSKILSFPIAENKKQKKTKIWSILIMFTS